MKEYIVKGRLDNKTGFMSFTVKQELIRCKDCKYYIYEEYGHRCINDDYVETGEEFCSWAERRGEE